MYDRQWFDVYIRIGEMVIANAHLEVQPDAGCKMFIKQTSAVSIDEILSNELNLL